MWTDPPETAELREGEVHLWRAELNAPQAWTDQAYETLASDEKERAERFIREEHGQRFTVARGTLRILLGIYTGRAPAQIAFVYGKDEKPALAPSTGDVEFNVSHSGDLALLAFSRDHIVGVDLESYREKLEIEKIARRYFSPAETQTLVDLPAHKQEEAFYRCWTRKEAYIKAKGDGMRIRLDAFDVSFSPGEAPKLLRSSEGQAECDAWTVYDIDVERKNFAAALVTRGTAIKVENWRFIHEQISTGLP